MDFSNQPHTLAGTTKNERKFITIQLISTATGMTWNQHFWNSGI